MGIDLAIELGIGVGISIELVCVASDYPLQFDVSSGTIAGLGSPNTTKFVIAGTSAGASAGGIV